VLLIFGFRMRGTTKSEGDFFCPKCGADRHYLLQRLRRWFTLFFIPIFPTGKEYGDQVKCTTCGSAFRPEVLNAPTSAMLSEYIRAAVRVAAVGMVAAGSGAMAVRTAAVELVAQSGTESYDDDTLTNDLAHYDATQLPSYVAPLAAGLKEQGKETFVAQLTRVALAGGPLTPAETAVLETVGAGLQLTAAHLRGIVDTVTTGTQA
jgi:hypothetical protein